MNSDTILSPQWDAHLLRGAATSPPTAAWSAVPLHTPYRYPHLHRGRAAVVCDHSEGCLAPAADGNSEEDGPPPHFLAFDGMEMPWLGPRLRLRPCALARPTPTLLWTYRFGFCGAELFRSALEHLPENRTSDSLDDCFMTAALLKAHAHLILPARRLASTLALHRSIPSQTFKPSDENRALLKHFHAFTNVDIEKAFVGQRARLGLSPDPSMEEIMIKYGSFSKYQHAHARLAKEKKLLDKNNR